MTRRNPMVYVHQMQDHAKTARDISRDYSRSDLDTNRMLNLAIQKVIQLVSTSASRVPDDLRRSQPEVPWEEAESFYHQSVKSYDDVNLDALWDTIQNDIPSLIEQLEYLMCKENSQ